MRARHGKLFQVMATPGQIIRLSELDYVQMIRTPLIPYQSVSEGVEVMDAARAKKQGISKALALQLQTLETKLCSTLRKLKHEKPKLFKITDREQIISLTGQIIGSYIRYLITE